MSIRWYLILNADVLMLIHKLNAELKWRIQANYRRCYRNNVRVTKETQSTLRRSETSNRWNHRTRTLCQQS